MFGTRVARLVFHPSSKCHGGGIHARLHMKWTVSGVAVVLAVALSIASASAQIPLTMSYQGVLTDNGGAIPTDGPYNFSFAIYDDPTLSGTHLLWTENQNGVSVQRGGFSVLLGMGTPAVPLALPFDKPYYL